MVSHKKIRASKAQKSLMPLAFSQWHLNRQAVMELLPGFEPGTSSLPTAAELFFVPAWRILEPQGIEMSGILLF